MAQATAAKFTLPAAQKIVTAVRQVLKEPIDMRGRRGVVRYVEGNSLFVVNVTQNGGSNGTAAGGLCTYTYDVYSRVTGLKIGSALAVQKPRLFGAPTTAATIGTAYTDHTGALALYDVGEQVTAAQCS